MTPKHLARLFSLLSLALALVGCITAGDKVDRDKVSQIKKGVTTRAEVEALLGPPTHVAIVGNGTRLMIYEYHETKVKGQNFIPYAGAFIGGTDNRRQNLQIILNENNVVTDYELTDRLSETTGGAFSRQEKRK